MDWIDHTKQILFRRVRTWSHPVMARAFHRWCVVGAVGLLAGAWVAAFAIPNLPGEAPLIVHYTTTFGVDALGGWDELARLPLMGTILVGVNIVLAVFLTNRSDDAPSPASAALLVVSVLIAFAVLVGSVLLLRINTGLLNGSSGF